ncbi:PP2C family protein-serine/threonine phosphatase [Sedimentitalea todarodis]|uniref:Fused response regulator/phosphatase n=1 Tax=Sedimentitalea todarodis TaxID=1631240 RepID=A0ABU3VDK2_9RHOB|nr:fused response regulator/phosphatase [Sedimentitalea todarodis]MDU9004253.1 fused response regulator/phosphatase [Sedimentitalea todarodis]
MSTAVPASRIQIAGQADFRSIRQVLLVDDSRLQRRIIASSLKKWGFEVIEAESGDTAIELCRNFRPDLVLSDWMMPGMSGLEFCRNFRDMSGADYAYFILLTSKSEKNEVAQGLDAGADDFLTKPVNADELRARISAGGRILDMQRELSDKNKLISDTLDQLRVAYDTIDKDLIQAKKIQQSLVPEFSRSFGESQVSLLLKPCGHIGGDLVGMFSPNDDEVAFYSIDVSGHGITSAMMTAKLGGLLSSAYPDQNLGMERQANGSYTLREPATVAEMLNERLLADSGIEEYFTMIYAVADLKTGVLKLVQSGHPYPLVLHADGRSEFVGEGGVPIGLLPKIRCSQFKVELTPGDRLLLYSDGFTESRLTSGEMLEEQGLVDLIGGCQAKRAGKEFLDDLFWGLTQKMSAEFGMEDDVSATLFEFKAL